MTKPISHFGYGVKHQPSGHKFALLLDVKRALKVTSLGTNFASRRRKGIGVKMLAKETTLPIPSSQQKCC